MESVKKVAGKIIDEYIDYFHSNGYLELDIIKISKACSLIAVDKLIKNTQSVAGMPPNCQELDESVKEFWRLVKLEIQNDIHHEYKKIK